MGQRPEAWTLRILAAFAACLALLGSAACDRSAAGPTPQQAAPAKRPTVASLVPAVTDLMLAMGAQDHLVAVSNYDIERDGTHGLPRVGDYHNTDWERLSVLRPDVMIIQLREDKVAPGFRLRAQNLGIRLVNIHINRLDDIFTTLRTVGEVCGEPAKAAALDTRLHAQLKAVRQRVAGVTPVPTLIVLDEDGQAVVGPRNYLDDLLTLAGGLNLGGTLGKDYPAIDREQLAELNPQAVIQLLPEAQPQVLTKARGAWSQMPALPAVRNQRVHILTDWYILLPGSQIGAVAEQFADLLHPRASAATMPASSPAPRQAAAGEGAQ